LFISEGVLVDLESGSLSCCGRLNRHRCGWLRRGLNNGLRSSSRLLSLDRLFGLRKFLRLGRLLRFNNLFHVLVFRLSHRLNHKFSHRHGDCLQLRFRFWLRHRLDWRLWCCFWDNLGYSFRHRCD
jgi:hypothetical protein